MPKTQKMTIITKLATHTAHDHNSQLMIKHLANTNDSSNLIDILARCTRTSSPLLENTRSIGAELAGTARILSNKYPRGTNSISLQMSASFVFSVKWYRINGVYVVNESRPGPRPRTSVTRPRPRTSVTRQRPRPRPRTSSQGQGQWLGFWP